MSAAPALKQAPQQSHGDDGDMSSLPASLLNEAAVAIAEDAVAMAVTAALNEDGRSLRQFERDWGIDVGFLSRLANGKNCQVSSLAKVALLLGKDLRISIE